jgi:hypothetical protein
MLLTTTWVANNASMPKPGEKGVQILVTVVIVGGLFIFWSIPLWILLFSALAVLAEETRLGAQEMGRQ